MPLQPKSQLGPYQILASLGAGGMGEVYRARDTRLGRQVAVKVLLDHLSSSPESRARFQREAVAISTLNHPHICVLHDIGREGDTDYLVMELVEGETLANRLTDGALPMPELLKLGTQIADALDRAHQAGVVHRDLKPGNIMITKNGAKLMDFGLALAARGLTDVIDDMTAPLAAVESITAEGTVVGTLQYMSPEQLEGKRADARSDIWALGCLLYEMASGKRPFEGTTLPTLVSMILRDNPRELSEVAPMSSGALDELVTRCLTKNPSERWQTAGDLKRELERMGETDPSAQRDTPATDQVASIAVLPFANRSASAEDEYFSDGLADELLNVLAKIQGLRVSARTSSFHFKGKDTTIAEIGRALKVATILEGSVRKAGNRIRVSVQLVKVSDGYHLWSNTYDRTLEDIFAVQDDIAQSVVSELRAALLGVHASTGQAKADVAKAAKGRSTNPEAHRLLLLARHLEDRGTQEDEAKAIEYLEQAVAMDPNYALAWAELSRALMNFAGVWGSMKECGPRARDAAERSVTLEPDLAEAHAARGRVLMYFDRDYRGAVMSFTRARELAPDNAEVLRVCGVMVAYLGQLEEAAEIARRAHELNPLSAASLFNVGSIHEAAGRFAEAEAWFRKALELAPQQSFAHASMSFALIGQGRRQEALQAASMEASEELRLYALAIVHHALGDRAESDRALQQLVAKYAEESAFQIADVHGARGEVDAAFEWLERAYAQGDLGVTQTKLTRRLHSLHGDPRWGPWLRKVGLES